MPRSSCLWVIASLLALASCKKHRQEPPQLPPAAGQAPASAPPAAGVKPIPDGFHTVTASLIVRGAAKALEFYKRAFGAEVFAQMSTPDGAKIVHADIRIGDSRMFLADEMPMPGSNYAAPETTQGKHTVGLWLYVPDVDASMKRAIEAGATQVRPAADMFWGDRMGHLRDPFGHEWAVATHKRDLSPEEIRKGAAEFMAKQALRK